MKVLNYMAGLAFAVLFLLAGCRNKELCPQCDQETGIEIKFDWSAVTTVPGGMTVLFYNMQNELIYTFNNVAPSGEKVQINAGEYQVACYNNDSEYVQWYDIPNMDSLYVETRKTDLLKGSDKLPVEDMVECPDFVCGDVLLKKEILADDPNLQIVLLKPMPLFCMYSYSISSIQNAEYITKTTATLSGLSQRYYLSNPDHQNGIITMPFKDNSLIDQQQTAIGSMYNFGDCHMQNRPNYLTLYIWSKGGNFRAVFDVTKQVQNAPNPKNVHIVIDTKIVVPPPISGDDGLDPSVDEWKDFYYDVIL